MCQSILCVCLPVYLINLQVGLALSGKIRLQSAEFGKCTLEKFPTKFPSTLRGGRKFRQVPTVVGTK